MENVRGRELGSGQGANPGGDKTGPTQDVTAKKGQRPKRATDMRN